MPTVAASATKARATVRSGLPRSLPRYRDAHVGGCLTARVRRLPDGSTHLQSTEALLPYPALLTDALEAWAQATPRRQLIAKRDATGSWQAITYAQMLQRVRAVGEYLCTLNLSPDRPLVLLSGNDLEHHTLALAAAWVGLPFAPVSTAYSLVSQDFGKLRHVLKTLTPGLVFASDPSYAKAIASTLNPNVPVMMTTGAVDTHVVTPFAQALTTQPGSAVDAAHAKVSADTILKFMFTSGSTKDPKAVITTNRMLCANLQMIRQCFVFLAETPPVLVDWLPWNHVFGGNHNTGIALYNGGTLYIDDGKPTPQGMAETLRNLREISPTIYFNVPKGLEEISRAMDSDKALRQRFFKRCQAIMYAGAGLSQAVWDKLDAHAERTVGERVRVVSGLGMTEASPSCTFAVGTNVKSTYIGLPAPGVQAKLVPMTATAKGKTEIRFRGPNLMPGYWRNAAATAEAFDDEGFYKTGDAVLWVNPKDTQQGLRFDGRVAEDFKLATGTFVSVGPLRARIVLAGDPCVQDVVITGIDRNEVGALVLPRMDACRALAQLPSSASPLDVLLHPAVRQFMQQLVQTVAAQATGSASRVTRWRWLDVPPSIDLGEVTDKGSINQRTVLQHRAALVEALYAHPNHDPLVALL
jgi:feruloyl-CoA synthase